MPFDKLRVRVITNRSLSLSKRTRYRGATCFLCHSKLLPYINDSDSRGTPEACPPGEAVLCRRTRERTPLACLCDSPVTIIADGYYSLQDLRSQAGAWERECALRQAQGTGDNKPVVEPVETNPVSESYLLPVPQQASACKTCVPKPELGNEWKSLILESGFGQLCHAERLLTTRTLPRQIRSDADGSALIIRFRRRHRHHLHPPEHLPPPLFQKAPHQAASPHQRQAEWF